VGGHIFVLAIRPGTFQPFLIIFFATGIFEITLSIIFEFLINYLKILIFV